MGGFAFRTGLVFEWLGIDYRIERLGNDEQVVLDRLNDGQIILTSQADLLSAFSDGNIRVQTANARDEAPKCYGRPLSELSEKNQDEIRRRMAYLRAMDQEGVRAFSQRHLEPVITQVAEQINDPRPPSWVTVYRWNFKYRYSKDVRALIPRFAHRGSSAVRQSEEILDLFAEATSEAFAASPAATIRSIHTRLAGKILLKNHNKLPEEQLEAPSMRTTYRLYARLPSYENTRLRKGKAAADNRHRIAKLAPEASCILERVEADHTPLDLFLIDERTGVPLGCPILTVLIDTFSRFPIGYFLNFGGASAMAVMGALRHAILRKLPADEAIPGLNIKHPWPCYGVMDSLVLDNGLEFHGTALEGAAMDLGIHLLFCPKRHPWYKGKIERFLQTFNFSLSHQMPGTSLSKLADRGEYDPQKHAVLTMAECKQVIEKWLLDVYAQTIQRGIRTTPWAKWHEGLKLRTPELPGSLDDLKKRIGLIDERKLQRDGITLRGIRYGGPELDEIMRTWGPGVRVRVVYDPEDLGTIQIWAPDQQDPLSIRALDQAYASGLTLVQHELIQRQIREAGHAVENPQALLQAKYDLAVSVDQLIQSRKQRTRRRAAKINGITSSHPDATLTATPPKKPKSVTPVFATEEEDPPQALPTFRLKGGGF